MASYGRNFDFRVPPYHGQRGARFVLPKTAGAKPVVIGAPVRHNGEPSDVNGLVPVELAVGASEPAVGLCGVLVYEVDPGVGGFDPLLTTYSDQDTAPVGRSVQVVSGDRVKVAFKNTEDRTFLETREYAGRKMVGGVDGISIGDFLTPGEGTDEGGYWATTTNKAEAWLVVEHVDAARGEVEARFTF